MSFYLDDDDHHVGLSQGSNLRLSFHSQHNSVQATQDDNNFVCDNCGGNQSYLDETTGGLTCAECFTQSQTIIAASQEEVDYDEVMNLAGRVSGGHLASTSSQGSRRQRRNTRLRELDHSTRLPTTQECIQGTQRIMKECVEVVAKLAHCDRSQKKAAFRAAKDIWKAYLWSWMEGADFFGARYPDVRLCFRDQFLNPNLRSRVVKNIVYKAYHQLHQEMLHQEQNQQQQPLQQQSYPPQRQTPIKAEPMSVDRSYSHTQGQSGPLESLPDLPELVEQPRDLDEMSQTSVLTTGSVAKAGARAKSSNPIAKMIRHYYRALKKTRMGRKAAALSLPPSLLMVAAIVTMAFSPMGITTVEVHGWIANGNLPLLNAFSILTRQEQKKLSPIAEFFRFQEPPTLAALEKTLSFLQVACGYTPRRIHIKNAGKSNKVHVAQSSVHFQPGRLIMPGTLPMVVARLVSLLGLSQTVLDYTLALFGVPVAGKTKQSQLPRPMSACRSDRISTVAQVLGVIVFACKLTPEWGTEGYHVASSGKHEKHAKLIPWSEGMVQRLSGSFEAGYLPQLEGDFLDSTKHALPNFAMALRVEKGMSHSTRHHDAVVLPSSAVTRPAARSAPNKSRKRTMEVFHCTETQEFPSLAQSIPAVDQLIEYMSTKTGVDHSGILDFVQKLDREIRIRGAKDSNVVRMPLQEAHALAQSEWMERASKRQRRSKEM